MTGKRPIRASPPAPTLTAIRSPTAVPWKDAHHGELFAHQRWDEFFPKVGYVLSLAEIADGQYYFHPNFPSSSQPASGATARASTRVGTLPPPLIKGRYGEPILTRIYNCLPDDVTKNGGFGRNEHQLHFHNAHNGAESDGAANVHHFPGTFYDYRWSTSLARRDKINTQATVKKASGPRRQRRLGAASPAIIASCRARMWAHDHRFFFTAENVYKGMLMMVNYYSGPDRGNDKITDGVNLQAAERQPLGLGQYRLRREPGVHDLATDSDGQCSSTSSRPTAFSATCCA